MIASILLLFASNRAAGAADIPLHLAVSINGRDTGLVAAVTERDGKLYARPAELEQVGLLVPSGVVVEDGLVALDSLPGVIFRFNAREQTLAITAAMSALRPSLIGPGARAAGVPVTPANPGVALDYDVQATRVENQTNVAGLFDGRVFGLGGLLESTAATYSLPTQGQTSFVRLDTTWTHADPNSLHRVSVGDVINGGLDWTRPLRMGGVQFNVDFALQPGVITFPLPTVTGQAALPSTADLLVNGVRQFSQTVIPGPFQIRQPPVLTGAGTLEVAVANPLGQQVVTTLPFYVSSDMLRPGLAAWSFEIGAARRDYGLLSDDYGIALGSATYRYGVTDWLTLETHAEGTTHLGMAGGDALLRIRNLGVLTASVAGSAGSGDPSTATAGRTSGTEFSIGFQRQATVFSFGASATKASDGFRDLAAVTGAPIVRSTYRANVGLALGKFGSFAVAYVDQRGAATAATTSLAQTILNPLLPITPTYKVITASYQVQLTDRLTLIGTAFANVDGSHSAGFEIGLSLSFGQRSAAYGGVSYDNTTGTSGVAQLQQSADLPGQFGYNLLDQEGGQPRHLAQGMYVGPWGQATVGVDNAPGLTATRADLRGGAAWAGGSLFYSRWIDDSFAVVESGDTPGVGVNVENRPIGKTGDDEKLLVPDLRGWDTNAISLTPTDLPPDVNAGPLRILVRPPEKSGVVVQFDVKHSRAAIIVLVDRAAKPLPVSSMVQRDGGGESVIGYGGETYLKDLTPANAVTVELPDGTSCHARFDYKPAPGTIPRIGPVVCQ